jgi:hypothetical protein
MQLDKQLIYVVDCSNPHATSVMRKIAKAARPGAIVEVTEEEFLALKHAVILLDSTGLGPPAKKDAPGG